MKERYFPVYKYHGGCFLANSREDAIDYAKANDLEINDQPISDRTIVTGLTGRQLYSSTVIQDGALYSLGAILHILTRENDGRTETINVIAETKHKAQVAVENRNSWSIDEFLLRVTPQALEAFYMTV